MFVEKVNLVQNDDDGENDDLDENKDEAVEG